MESVLDGCFISVRNGPMFPLGAAVLCCPSRSCPQSPIHEVHKAPAPTCQCKGPATLRAFVVASGGATSRQPSWKGSLCAWLPLQSSRDLGFTNHPQFQGRAELRSHQRGARDAEPPSFHPLPAPASAASSVQRRLKKIRAGSTSPAPLGLFVPHPSSTLGCFTYQLSPPEIPTGKVQVKATAFKLLMTGVKHKTRSNNFPAVGVVRPKAWS